MEEKQIDHSEHRWAAQGEDVSCIKCDCRPASVQSTLACVDGKDEVKQGDVRLVRMDDGTPSSIAVIIQLHEEDGFKWANVMHCHDDLEMATSIDLVLNPASATCNITSHIVVQTDLYTTCDMKNIHECLGTIGDHEAECISSVFRNQRPQSDQHWSGPRMTGELDHRWQFKVEQGEHARTVQQETLQRLLA